MANIDDEQTKREQERRKNQLEKMQPIQDKKACADCRIFWKARSINAYIEFIIYRA